MRLVDDLEWRVGKDLEGKVVAYFKVRSWQSFGEAGRLQGASVRPVCNPAEIWTVFFANKGLQVYDVLLRHPVSCNPHEIV